MTFLDVAGGLFLLSGCCGLKQGSSLNWLSKQNKPCHGIVLHLGSNIPMMPFVRHCVTPCWPLGFHGPQNRWRFRSGRLSTVGSSSTNWPSSCRVAPSWYLGPYTLSGTLDRGGARLCWSTWRTPSTYGWQRRNPASPCCRTSTGRHRAPLPPLVRSKTSVRWLPLGRTPVWTWFLWSKRAVPSSLLWPWNYSREPF